MVTSIIATKAAAAQRPAQSASVLPVPLGQLLDRWHLMSLDAPTVAIVWTYAFAHASGAHIPFLGPLMLALATWLLYVTDRLLDGMQPPHAASLQERHLFHALHRRLLVRLSIPAITALLWFVLTRMDPAPRREDLFIAGCALLYLLFVHLPLSPAKRQNFQLPKELFVGLIFAAACVVPSWSRQPVERPRLLVLSALFAALCWLNCVAIEHWESRGDGARYDKHAATIWMGEHLSLLCLLLTSLACMASILFFALGSMSGCVYVACIGVSSVLLDLLNRNRSRWKPLRVRAAADAALLTPVTLLLASPLLSVLHLHLF